MMTEVFRGLLDILHKHDDTLHRDIVTHLRRFDRKHKDMEESEIRVGVFGFWRLMLEQIMNIYLWLTNGLGIFLVLTLTVLSFPMRLIIGSFSLMMGNMQREQHLYEAAIAEPTPANDNAQPDDKQVVRRVVYEEAKVAKGNSK